MAAALAALLTEHADKLWSWVQVGEHDECWPWTRGRQSRGYGVLWLPGRRSVLTHRAALILHSGGVEPDGHSALHSCDNPPCCNPHHLRWGTHAENMQDGVDRGRMKSGLVMPDACRKAGHDLTNPNNVGTKTRKQKGKVYEVHYCRECNKAYMKDYHARTKERA